MANPKCDFDCWTITDHQASWMREMKATLLHSAWGFDFWEHPLRGDEAPVLATVAGDDGSGRVYNTQDFDLPTSDPKTPW